MSVRLFVLSAMSTVSALPALAAQERQQVPRAKIYIQGDEPQVIRERIRAITQRRARLGVTVDLRANETDSIGATLQSVTPGGPAAKAGLRSGDIVTKLNGKSLVATDNTRAGEGESLPGVRLVEYAAQLKPNETVTIGTGVPAWLRVVRRIVDREHVAELFVGHSRDAFRHGALGRDEECDPTSHASRIVRCEVLRFDDQRIALPPPDRIARPRRHGGRRVAGIQTDYAGEVH